MTTWDLFTTTWSFKPTVVFGCGALVWGYIGLLRGRMYARAIWYVLGVIILLLALTSPLDTLSHTYLFSAHMSQHLLLVLVVPPLLLLGLPAWGVRRLTAHPTIDRCERWFRQPLVAWLLGIGTLWLWHVPVLYNAALTHEALHIAEHLTFLVTATIFWWPIVTPVAKRRMPPLVALPYLFAAAIANSLLGILLTFLPPGIYPTYIAPVDPLGLVPMIRQVWGISPAIDQQMGGLLMWIPGGLVMLSALLGTLLRWFRTSEDGAWQTT